MTAAEILREAEPPSDDTLIEKAIADLDVKIWEWADALKSAQSQLRTAFAVRPPVAPAGRPSAALYDNVAASLPAAAAAAHIQPPPPMPAEWTAPPAAPKGDWVPPPSSLEDATPTDWAAAGAQFGKRPAQHGGHGASSSHSTSTADQAAAAATWQQPADNAGTMAWPTTPAGGWPDASTSSASGGSQAWPTWTPNDAAAEEANAKKKAGSNVRASKAPRATRPVVEGPTPEERAQKAAAEEALLSELDDAIARRVRLLRRLDPDTAIEKLIEKARQGHAEGAAAAPTASKDDKSSSSWWRRK